MSPSDGYFLVQPVTKTNCSRPRFCVYYDVPANTAKRHALRYAPALYTPNISHLSYAVSFNFSIPPGFTRTTFSLVHTSRLLARGDMISLSTITEYNHYQLSLPTLQFFLPRLLPIEVTVFSRFSCLKQHSISDGIPYCSATAYVVRGLLAGIRELMHEIKV